MKATSSALDWRSAIVERESELQALGAVMKHGATDGQVVLIKGPAGIGKTRPLDVLRREAAGFDVMGARGGVLERDIAFGVVRQLLEPRLTRAALGDRDALLAGAAAPAAGILCLARGDQELVRSELSRSLHALFWLVANLAARQPLVLAVDDGQWADATSLEFLAYLARRLEGLPVLIAVTASPAPFFAPARGRPSARELSSPLVTPTSDDPTLRRRVDESHRRSAGEGCNPFPARRNAGVSGHHGAGSTHVGLSTQRCPGRASAGQGSWSQIGPSDLYPKPD